MTAPRSGGGGPATRSAGGAMVRGLVLIIVAVLLGVVVLRATDEPLAVAESEPVVVPTTVAEDRDPGVDRTEPPDEEDPEDGTEADEEGATEEATEDEEAGATEGDEETAAGATSTTSVPGARPPADVSVLVANGSGVSGAAGELTDRVGEAGYETAQPANIRDDGTVRGSTVYYAEGYAAEANALAATLTPPPPVAPMPDPAPVDDLRGATVLLVVGPDLAGD